MHRSRIETHGGDILITKATLSYSNTEKRFNLIHYTAAND